MALGVCVRETREIMSVSELTNGSAAKFMYFSWIYLVFELLLLLQPICSARDEDGFNFAELVSTALLLAFY